MVETHAERRQRRVGQLVAALGTRIRSKRLRSDGGTVTGGRKRFGKLLAVNAR
jgi:hypothetical protein